ncbi:type III restriction enzyme [Paenibacillus endophyticus]|uniref:Type III restriction enzyme n=1 Tax=Paenibacillus endophyticus TaxID=1294268 RepID=A0A7W5GB07_9BACL|nr:DEAD/DEAH box helicase family protein [Paenibacillus endophyticus]MBB3152472.1 type III restriction enzyme [Paenibacillus endophyticus]
MKIKFDADQQYQKDAVQSIVDLFDGQTVKTSHFTVSLDNQVSMSETDLGFANKLDLLEEEIIKNVQTIQLRNALPKSITINESGAFNFTIEMETGTGKTYVYLRTIYELNERYGFSKFIIVVPSLAIREGVYKSLQMTEEHFGNLYENQNCDYFIYDSSKLGQLRTFATSSDIQIMIINIDAFRKSFNDPEKQDKANIIHRENDRMSGRKPIDFISQTNPIVIIDEPQSVDNTDKAKEAIASLNPLCVLRYSATHKEKYNLMYRLDPVDAYQKKLVKQIKVTSIKTMDNFNKPYLKLVSVSRSNGFKAVLEMDVKRSNGTVARMTKTVKQNDDLFDKSSERDLYNGYIVSNIDCYDGNESIEFTNGIILALGQVTGDIDEDEMKRAQIHATIEENLNKERKLVPLGIKVLSLFFIDRVEHYRSYDDEGNPVKGKYAIMFEEEYNKLIQLPKYQSLFKDAEYMLNYDPEQVHNGYFSIDGRGKLKDTRGNTEADNSTYNLIMKDKERLLSFETPLRFIFSHSTLKEGWDNPNIFQVCTLIEASDTFTKRQKIGRGLRLAVNQDGDRIYDSNLNILTVIANESFEEFAENLQKEIEDETGVKFGIVEKHSFANMVVTDDSGQTTNLGFEQSELIWKHLYTNKLVQKNGKVTDELKKKINEELFELPQEYKALEQQVIEVIRRSVAKLEIKDGRKEIQLQLNKQVYLSPEFELLWEKIKHKTTYSVKMDIETLVKHCVDEISYMPEIKSSSLVRTDAQIYVKKSSVEGKLTSTKIMERLQIEAPLPDLLRFIQDETRLTRKTIVEILIQANRFDDFKSNPQKFMEVATDIIRKNMKRMVTSGIKYEKIAGQEYYKQEIFESQELLGYLDSNAFKVDKSVYSHIIYDSEIERAFAEKMNADDDVKLFAKLPSTFKIETPIGNYNPDWAVVIDQDGSEKLFFIIETKGTIDNDQLRMFESSKIAFGRQHFEALKSGVEYVLANDYIEFKQSDHF